MTRYIGTTIFGVLLFAVAFCAFDNTAFAQTFTGTEVGPTEVTAEDCAELDAQNILAGMAKVSETFTAHAAVNGITLPPGNVIPVGCKINPGTGWKTCSSSGCVDGKCASCWCDLNTKGIFIGCACR